MNSAFIDSNVIIKYFTGDTTAKDALAPVIKYEVEGYINSIVYSEVIYIAIKLLTRKKAYELKENPESIRNAIKAISKHVEFVRTYFKELETNDKVKQIAIEIMKEYGLLPNDALIAATCKYYGIDVILTFDEDFKRIPWLKTLP
ncbi:MAG: PIN domain-containing protein [Staphylothermus sp.]|nr:PIN domain-containing protein [Staphylothermus sp.]